MPPQIQALLQDKQKLMIAGIALAVILVLGIGSMFMFGGNKENVDPGEKKLEEKQLALASIKNLGRAIEIQALLAREGIRLDREEAEGGVFTLKFDKDATLNDRDRALLTLVQSGLMDGNIGLEAFDQGDLTASREEKRIKLIRAQQGELARIIRKIKPIEEASVHISIPDPSVFRRDEKPTSASVQVNLPVGERLTQDKVRSIINLMVGSIQGLDAAHVAIADTNGNTYNSVVDGGAELQNKLEERDQYMKQKVTEQLNKLVGPGHFVVTVSTLLREAPMETMVESYEPDQTVVSSKQQFTESMNSSGGSGLSGSSGGALSTMLPKGMRATSMSSGGLSSRGYVREGTEVEYRNAKTQWVETSVPGMMEDISIAVTIDREYFPQDMRRGDLQKLLARAASPKVTPSNVSIAQTDFHRPMPALGGSVAGAGSLGDGVPVDWIPWAVGSAGVLLLLVFVAVVAGGKGKGVDPQVMAQTHQELAQLREIAAQQQAQFHAAQQQTRQMLEEQQRQLQQSVAMIPQQQPQQPPPSAHHLKQVLAELAETVRAEAAEMDEIDLPIKSWIES